MNFLWLTSRHVPFSSTNARKIYNIKSADKNGLERSDHNQRYAMLKKGLAALKNSFYFSLILFLIIGSGMFNPFNFNSTQEDDPQEDAIVTIDDASVTYNSNGKQITIKRISSSSSSSNTIDQSNSDTTSSDTSTKLELNSHFDAYGCDSTDKVLLLNNKGFDKTYLSGFTYDVFTANLNTLTSSNLLPYRIVIFEPDFLNYNTYRNSVIPAIMGALQSSPCLTVGMRIATTNNQINIDMPGTDFVYQLNDVVTFYDPNHPLITGIPYGGTEVFVDDLLGWGTTSMGYFAQLPTGANGYTPILNNSQGITLFEYNYGNGHVVVDTLSSLSGGWGIGNPYFASNYMKYLNYTSYYYQSPLLNEHSNDITIKDNTTGNNLSWKFSDTDPDMYYIYKNTVLNQSGSWLDNETISVNIDGLAVGSYNYTIEAFDDLGHSTVHEITVTVVEGNAPIFTSVPQPPDLNYIVGTTGNTLTWIAIDDTQAGIYNVYKDEILDVANSNLAWTNNSGIIVPIDGLIIGPHNITIEIFDAAGNWAVSTVNVNVEADTELPNFVIAPTNTSVPLYSTTDTLTWQITDASPDNYFVLVEDVEIQSGTYTSGGSIVVDIDASTLGLYNYTIYANDTNGNENSHTLFVTVYDAVDPAFAVPPLSSYNYEFASTNNKLEWTAIDEFPTVFEIYRNSSVILSTGWVNNVKVTLNIDGLGLGFYNYTAVFYDVNGNTVKHETTVHVEDTTDPTIPTSPNDVTREQRSSGGKISWTATDLNPSRYVIYINGTEYQDGAWSSGIQIQTTINTTSLGFFDYTISFNDTSGNTVTDTVIVHIQDTINPIVTGPGSNPNYIEDSTDNFIDWIATDLNPDYYEIYRNNVQIAIGGWLSGSTIHFNIDGLTTGNYNFTLVAYDESLRFGKFQVDIIVIDNTPPEFEQVPSNLIYSLDTTGNTLTWIATDNHPSTYIIYREHVNIKSGPWVSSGSITINVDGLGEGSYNYTIVLKDQTGNENKHEVDVSVSGSPVIEPGISEYHYTNNTSGHTLSWIVEDANPSHYIIYNQSIEVASGTWVNGIPITIGIDNLLIGEYNFTLWANDTEGISITNQIDVFVTDIPILVASPGNITYNEEDLTIRNLQWNATDSLPDTFEIYQNDNVILSGDWNNTGNVTVYVDGLPAGVYNYTIVFYDTVGNIVKHTAWVTVDDTTDPNFDVTTNDASYTEASTGNTIVWSVIDKHPDYYYVQRDGVNVTGELSWNNATDITLNIDFLIDGVYTFEIFVFDESGNMNSDVVEITVNDLSNPILNSPDDLEYNERDIGNSISWTGTDLNPMNYTVIVDGGNYTAYIWDEGVWNSGVPILISVDDLNIGIYTFTITLNDTSGNTSTPDSVQVTVLDVVNPGITPASDYLSYSEDITGNEILWTATDRYPNEWHTERNGTFYSEGTWNDGEQFSVNIDGWSIGYWEFTIYINDTSGNTISDSIIVLVSDILLPGIDNPSDILDYEHGSSYDIIWTATDTNPYNYTVTKDGQFFVNGIWEDNVGIIVNIDGLELGSYTFTITVQDIAGNIETDSVDVAVVDTTAPSFVSSSGGITYELGDVSNTLTWTFTELLPHKYNVTLDGSDYTSNAYTNNQMIIVNVDGLSVGLYTFTIYVNDTSGNWETDTLMVTVEDTIGPELNSPINVNYPYSSTNNIITWIATDLDPGTYSLQINGVPDQSGISWTSGIEIVIDIDGLEIGSYTYNLTVYDSSGNADWDVVIVTVSDENPPIFTVSPSATNFDEGSTGNFLTWTAADSNPSNYTVNIDEILFYQDDWVSGIEVSISLDSLTYGTYQIDIFVRDTSGNVKNHQLILSVFDNDIDAPVFTRTPLTELNMSDGSIGYTLRWALTDANPDVYNLYRNGNLIRTNEPWSSGVSFTLSLDFYVIGTYNFTIIVFDDYGNFAKYTNFVYVTDEIPPVPQELPSDITYNEETIGHILKWKVTDETDEGSYEIFRNGTSIMNGTWVVNVEIEINVDGLLNGVYNYTLFAYDLWGNVYEHWVLVTVYDGNSPIVDAFFVDNDEDIYTFNETLTPEILVWNIIETHPNYFELRVDGSLVSWGNFTDSVLYDTSSLLPGTHEFVLSVWDESDNLTVHESTIEKMDNTIPVFIMEPDNEYIFIRGINDSNIGWRVNDKYPGVYSISINGQPYENGPWFNGQNITFIPTTLSFGVYTLTIKIFDLSDNELTDHLLIEIKNPNIIETQEPAIRDSFLQVHEGDYELLNGTWLTLETETPINDANIEIKLFEAGRLLESEIVNTNQFGYFEIYLNYSRLTVGVYYWEIVFSKPSYETWTFIVDFEVKPHQYRIDLQSSAELRRGQRYYITATVYYNNSNDTSSLGLNELFPITGKAVGVEVVFSIRIKYIDNTESVLSRSDTTSSNGIAVFELRESETAEIQSLLEISAGIAETEYSSEAFSQLDSSQLPTVVSPDIDLAGTFGEFVEDNFATLILLVLFTISMLVLVVIIRRRFTRRLKSVLKEMTDARTELKDIESIRAVIIQSDSGVPLYERRINQFGVDTTLVSGLLSAVSAFLGEVSADDKNGFETLEREGLSITTHKADDSNMIFISTKKLSLYSLDKLKIAHFDLEKKFSNRLTSFIAGEFLDEEAVDELFEEHGINLNIFQPLKLNKRNLRRISKMRSISRTVRDNIKLLEQPFYGSPGSTMSLDAIIDELEEVSHLSDEMIARIILLTYRNGALIPDNNGHDH